jgi:hypothetical protein
MTQEQIDSQKLTPFLKVAKGIPKNWPDECILRFDQRNDGSIYLSYHGFNDASDGITIKQWRALLEDDSNYCETCGSCGETGCCSPIKCQAVKCKYGEINLKDYECFQNQWEIMFNALKELADFDYNKIATDALNAVDKEWDKLYIKE